LKSYLIVDDNGDFGTEPIEPSFYAFGSGEFDVQIVDIELTDLPPIECAGDTLATGDGCKTSCEIQEIYTNSGQTNELNCFDGSDEKLEAKQARVPAGGYCVVSCDNKEGKVPSPQGGRTTCKPNSEWSNPLKCSAKCPPDLLKKGQLIIENKKENNDFFYSVECRDESNGIIQDLDYIVAGSTCSAGNKESSYCGYDGKGYFYYNTEDSDILCSEDGKWVTDSTPPKEIVDPICKSIPCNKLSKDNVGNGKLVECKLGGEAAKVLNDKFMNEGAICTLTECDDSFWVKEPSTTKCENGAWSTELGCTPRDKTCTEAAIPTITNGNVDCDGNDRDATTNDFLGGSTCKVTCDQGHLKDGTVQCVKQEANAGGSGKWTIATCLEDKRCLLANLPSISNGNVECQKSRRHVGSRAGQYFEDGTKCQINCGSGYEISDSKNAAVTCKSKSWEYSGSCLTMKCDTSEVPTIPFGSVSCPEEKKVYRKDDNCPVACNNGYQHQTSNRVMLCGTNGIWGLGDLKCGRNGNWGVWGSWSSCSETCGTDGRRTRARACDNPAPDNGGAPCSTDSKGATDTEDCNRECCPVTAKWNSWGSWSKCENGWFTCGTGSRKRTRTCKKGSCPVTECSGNNEESGTCSMGRTCCTGGIYSCCNHGLCGYGEGLCEGDWQCKGRAGGKGYCGCNCRSLGLPGNWVWDWNDSCCC